MLIVPQHVKQWLHLEERIVPVRAEWLLKALWETAGELETALTNVRVDATVEHPVSGEYSVVELAGRVRDYELVTGAHLERLAFFGASTLPRHDLEWLEPDRDYESMGVDQLAFDFVRLRRRTCGLLWDLSPSEWARRAAHPFLGEVSVERLAVSLHEHDIDALWRVSVVTKALLTSR